LIITIGTADVMLSGVAPSLSLAKLLASKPGTAGASVYGVLAWLIDFMNLVVLAMVGYGFFRRIVLQPRLIPMNLDAGLILGGIAGLMITHFLYHGMEAVALGATSVPRAPVTSALAGWFQGGYGMYLTPKAAHAISLGAYWTHVVIVLAFLN